MAWFFTNDMTTNSMLGFPILQGKSQCTNVGALIMKKKQKLRPLSADVYQEFMEWVYKLYLLISLYKINYRARRYGRKVQKKDQQHHLKRHIRKIKSIHNAVKYKLTFATVMVKKIWSNYNDNRRIELTCGFVVSEVVP